MSMTLLEAYNQMLAGVGEQPISDTQTEAYIVAELSPYLSRAKKEVLNHGWRFNTDSVTLAPDGNNNVSIGTNALRIVFKDGYEYLDIRDGKVWNPTKGSKYTKSVAVYKITDLEFQSLPYAFQSWIAAEATAKLVAVKAPEVLRIYLAEAMSAKRTAINSQDFDMGGAFGVGKLVGDYNV